MTRIKASGIAHATLTVSNISKTKSFYEELLDVKIEMDDKTSFGLLDAGIPCWFVEWGKYVSSDKFDETRIGLDHIAFKLKTLNQLKQVILQLDKMGIENAGLERFLGKYPYVAFRDPDNIQTEFFIDEEL